MIAGITAMVAGLIVFVLSAIKTVSLWRDSRDSTRVGSRDVKRLNKRMRKLETQATRNIREIEKVQGERLRLRLEMAHALREQKGMTDEQITEHFKSLY